MVVDLGGNALPFHVGVLRLRSDRATVRAPTWMPSRCSCPAILMVVLCVHRQLLIGSPAFSLSSSLSISSITSGVFFPSACGRRVCVPAPTPRAVPTVPCARGPLYADPVAATQPPSGRPRGRTSGIPDRHTNGAVARREGWRKESEKLSTPSERLRRPRCQGYPATLLTTRVLGLGQPGLV